MVMKSEREYTISFATPAFLGNFQQHGQWRTPPFKAALRYWWRISMSKKHGYSYCKLRESEKYIFGHASDGSPKKSKIYLRLDRWNEQRKSFQSNEKFEKVGRGRGISTDLYLGYGPVSPDSKTSNRTYLPNGQTAKLGIRFPSEYEKEINEALNLMSWFGTLGSRSRNGWGSLIIDGESIERFSLINAKPYMRELDKCLECDWPHALGMDNGAPLLWESTKQFDAWEDAVNCLAKLKYEMREEAKKHRFDNSRDELIAGIHLLGYPAGNKWNLRNCDGKRLPSPIRFKIIQDESQKYICRVFHMPTCFPTKFMACLDPQERNWVKQKQLEIYQKIHQVIESHSRFDRCK
ncbi:MAG: type III-B CRISPR module RAMP protein Cmr1 [Gammaproteobacteria bacterium]|nr:type III-B CRISPR module RAMP protein Cmr1 [Gammaproteobacteria bacterium]